MNLSKALTIKPSLYFGRPQFSSQVLIIFIFLYIGISAQFSILSNYKLADEIGQAVIDKSIKGVYGPVPLQGSRNTSYGFTGVRGSFGGIELWRLSEFHPDELEAQILFSINAPMRKRVRKYLKTALNFSERFQVDPFWVLSVIYTESHFKPNAKSYVNAIGLMQIMPGTSHYLSRLIGKPMSPHIAYKMAKDPKYNMEMGTFYLDYLLKKFKGNYRLATVAYNMGPGNVRNRIRLNLPVGVKNYYLDKVRKNYRELSKLTRIELYKRPAPYELSYAVSHSRLLNAKKIDHFIGYHDSLNFPL